MNSTNWKYRAAQAICSDMPIEESPDMVLARKLYDAIPKVPTKDKDFSQSLYNGFVKYGSFTDKQRHWAGVMVERAAAPPAAMKPRVYDLDLSGVPAGRYAVEQRRIQIDKPVDGKWAGWTFVKDGSDYGSARRIAGGRPEWNGCVEIQGSAQMSLDRLDLEAIIANPLEAAKQYAKIAGRCCICNLVLENPESVARGVGPICAGKFGV